MAVQEIPEEEKEDDEAQLWMVKQLSEDKLKFVWPCLINIILKGELFEIVPSQEIMEIGSKLQNATPKTFNTLLTYDEKCKILLFLCNSCHDLSAFREYISKRLKEKHKYSSEKQETYNQIRQQEAEKKRMMEQNSNKDFVKNNEVQNEIDSLEEELKNASRTQSKVIKDKLSVLTKDKEDFRKRIQEIEDKIEALYDKTKKLSDQIFKVSLKVSIIGRDLNNEYWFFKDEPSKLYVKNIETNTWGYYNDEESIQELENSLITRGAKEK